MGRTARGEGAKGSALLFLMAHELDFRKHLKNSKVPIDEYEMDWDLVPELNVHVSLEAQLSYACGMLMMFCVESRVANCFL